MICAGVFDDLVAQLALAHYQEILERNRRILEENLAILDQWIEERTPRFLYPSSGCFH